MKKNEILLSSGCILWYGLEEAVRFATEVGCDGLELLPTRRITKDLRDNNKLSKFLPFIKSIHHSWRLDINQDRFYAIPLFTSLFFNSIRYAFFPSNHFSREVISSIIKNNDLPVTVHNLTDKWLLNNEGKEYGHILYEIMGDTSVKPEKIKAWLNSDHHYIAIDTRDDQSLIWAKENGFNDWTEFWSWLGLNKIKNIQLSLIGKQGIKQILYHRSSFAEQQLLWLHENHWEGTVTIEVNPISLFLLTKADLRKGLTIITQFVRQTCTNGENWS